MNIAPQSTHPPNLTEATVDIYRFSGKALEYDPRSAPLYARSFFVTVGVDGVDLDLIGF